MKVVALKNVLGELVLACCTSPNATGLFGGALQAYATTNEDGSPQKCAGELVLACCTSPNATGLCGGAIQACAAVKGDTHTHTHTV